MLTAIIATILTIAVIAAVALLIYMLVRRRSQGEFVKKSDVEHINTLNIGNDKSLRKRGSQGAHSHIRVNASEANLAKPSDKMSSRFGVFGIAAGAVFGILVAKAWSMQLLESERYASASENNLYTSMSLPASRGRIFDRNGVPLVKNRFIQTVLADSEVADDKRTVKRLSTVLGIPESVIAQRIKDESAGAQSKRTVASDVRLRDVAYISEHSDAFPGVSIEEIAEREYPYGALAAHALGYTRSATEEDVEEANDGRNIELTDVIGKSGLEYYYDDVLAGDKGTRRMMVDASGNIVRIVDEISSTQGSDIITTLDAHAQFVTDELLARTVAPLGDIGTGKGVSACVVALDVTDGSVVVMSSYPTFDPSSLDDSNIWELYMKDESHAPFVNRAINGQYAPASTFKAFTSMAGLNYGYASYGSVWTCTGEWDGFGSGDVQRCWDNYGHGTLDLHDGIVNSCDVVFYEIAKAFFDHGPDGSGELSQTALQEYLSKFRFGETTGIDLAGEYSGLIPTPEWKAKQWRNVPSEAIWRGGDYSNMIIGQGDVLVTPLQLACAYGAIATGDIMRPHLLKEIHNSVGDVVFEAQPEVVASLDVDEDHLAYVRRALHDMIPAHDDLASHFARYNLDAAAKSGTAEHTDKKDDAWFAAYAPFDNPKYVAVCIVEQGGGGSDIAGPIVAEVLGTLLGEQLEPGAGLGYINGSSGNSIAVEFTGNARRQD